MMGFRLHGGPRDGQIVDELPEGYTADGFGHPVGDYPADAPLMSNIPESATYDATREDAESANFGGDSAE
ncbi:MAG TPA: hypothetical protein VEX42_08960 [Microbacterium sp.]|nr:hypothetical protein [Microbacterium sp.]